MAKRKSVDWEAIEREYRAGMLSLREIGRTHGCDHKTISAKAKRLGWARDLSGKIRTGIIARSSAPSTPTSTPSQMGNVGENDIVDAAVERGVQIKRTHQKMAADLGRMITSLVKNWERYVAGEDPQPLLFGERESPSAYVARTVEATKAYIQIELQAWNLDEKDRNEPARPAPINIPFELLENDAWVEGLERHLPKLPADNGE